MDNPLQMDWSKNSACPKKSDVYGGNDGKRWNGEGSLGATVSS